MSDHRPPLRMIAAGKVYRSDSDRDALANVPSDRRITFDKHATFVGLERTLSEFLKRF